MDNVATLLDDAEPGSVACLGIAEEEALAAVEPIRRGHKIALIDIPAGGAVTKYGVPIGHAIKPIPRGAWVHLHNLASDLDERSGGFDLDSGTPSDTDSAYV